MSDSPVEAKVCPKCGGKLIKGVTISTSLIASFFGPLLVNKWSNVLGKRSGARPINTWACEKCGYLESYLKT